ncbi:MAG: BatD family protein [Tenacibaculum sp.]
MKTSTTLFTLILIFTMVLSVKAQEAKLVASVSKNKLGLNQRFKIEYTINKKGADSFKSPNFKNFTIVGGPSQSISESWINGKVSYSQTYSYVLQPKKKGEFNLIPASININGKTIFSNSLKIIVLDPVALPKDPNDPSYIASQNIHLVAEISKSTPYVGEGIYLEYRLYFSENVGISDNSISQSPEYIGFWNQEIKSSRASVKEGIYNGEKYRYAVLHKTLLIPTRSGNLTIDSMKMNIVVVVPTGKVDFFGNVGTRRVRKEFASAKKTIAVKALPTHNKPENFNGAVGQFSFDIALNKQILKANESAEVITSIKGKGNLKLFELPEIDTPKELEVYQPERKEKVSITSSGLSGSVSNRYTLVPQYKGKYKIPSVSFSYFNPKSGVYQTINSEDLYIVVLEGKELASNTSIIKQDVKITGSSFRYIQTSTNLSSVNKSNFFNSSLYYILLFLPVVIMPAILIFYKKKEKRSKDVQGNKQRLADKLAKKYLFEAKKQLGSKEAFYEALERALHNYLKAKLKVETSDISRDKITSLLEDKKVENNIINGFITVLNDCDFARYTPVDNLKMKQEFSKAKQIIAQLDKQL